MNPLLPTSRSATTHRAPAMSGPPADRVRGTFRWLASRTAAVTGSPWAFATAVTCVVVWALLGPHFHYSDTWQLVINTGTTIITFLMVFLIQNTQNRDARAIHLKLDELIRGIDAARNRMLDLENCSDEEIAHYEAQFHRLRQRSVQESDPQDAS